MRLDIMRTIEVNYEDMRRCGEACRFIQFESSHCKCVLFSNEVGCPRVLQVGREASDAYRCPECLEAAGSLEDDYVSRALAMNGMGI